MFDLVFALLASAEQAQVPLIQVSDAQPFKDAALEHWDDFLSFLSEQLKLVIGLAIAALVAWMKSRWSAFMLEGPTLARALETERAAAKLAARGEKPPSRAKRAQTLKKSADDVHWVHRFNLPGTHRIVLEKRVMPEVQRQSSPPVAGYRTEKP